MLEFCDLKIRYGTCPKKYIYIRYGRKNISNEENEQYIILQDKRVKVPKTSQTPKIKNKNLDTKIWTIFKTVQYTLKFSLNLWIFFKTRNHCQKQIRNL